MDLEIKVIRKKPRKHNNMPACEGEIIIGNFWEPFNMYIGYWSMNDYKRQWTEGLERIKHENVSCLVSSIQNPKIAPLLDCWLLYKENTTIYIQNRLYVEEYYAAAIIGDFTPENCYQYIEPRYIPFGPQDFVSEWSVDVWW